jgi:hypothetical protein
MIENIFPNKRWLVIPTSITNSIDFSQIEETSVDTLRLSIDETETFVKYSITDVTASYTQSYWDQETNKLVNYIVEAGIYGRPSIYTSSYSEYEYLPMLELLATPAWTSGSLPTILI